MILLHIIELELRDINAIVTLLSTSLTFLPASFGMHAQYTTATQHEDLLTKHRKRRAES